LVSTNAGGTQVLRHGTMRALVAGLEAVLPDGSIYHGLTALKKDNRGYDLKQLLIGGEGTIGIVTGVTVKTVPALIDRCVIWAGLDSPEQAYDLLQFLSGRAGTNLEGFEILPESCAASVMTHIPDVRRPLEGRFAWYALAELVRDSADGPDVQALAERLMSDAMELGLARDAAISANEAQAENCWKIRDSIAEAERASGPALQHDISVPVEKMAAFITSASPEVEARFPGTAVAAFGHLGDGNVHFHVKAPLGETKAWMDAQAGSISALVYDLVAREGGSISAEHGIGQNKLAELARLSDPAHLLALRAIKTAFDPDNLFNPGKLVPLA
jgi:FAD/FMN-containing dehydrogenase